MLREIIKLFPASSSTSPSLSRRGSVDPGSPQSSQTSVPTALSPDPSAPSMFDSFLSSAFQSNQSTALSDEALTNSFDCDQQHSPKKRKRTLSPRQPPVSARPRMPGKNTHRILRPLHSAVHPPSNTDTLTEWLASAYTENIRPVSHAINPWGDPVCSHVRTSVEEEDEVNASCASDERSLSSVDSVSDGSVSRGETYVRKRYEPIRDSHLPIARPVAMVRPASSRLDDAVDSVVYQPPTMQPFILNQTLFYSRRREVRCSELCEEVGINCQQPCAVCANESVVHTFAILCSAHRFIQPRLRPRSDRCNVECFTQVDYMDCFCSARLLTWVFMQSMPDAVVAEWTSEHFRDRWALDVCQLSDAFTT